MIEKKSHFSRGKNKTPRLGVLFSDGMYIYWNTQGARITSICWKKKSTIKPIAIFVSQVLRCFAWSESFPKTVYAKPKRVSQSTESAYPT